MSYKAGQKITLKPGFQVYNGSNFYASVIRIDCSSSGTNYSITGNDDGKDSAEYSFFDFFQPHNIPQETVDINFNYDQSEENNLISNEKAETEKFKKSAEFSLFPNPAKDFVKITIPNAFIGKNTKVIVYSTLSNLIKEFTLKTDIKKEYNIEIYSLSGKKITLTILLVLFGFVSNAQTQNSISVILSIS